MEGEIVNKVANAQIEQIDLLDFVDKNPLKSIDLKDLLWNELVLREKEFRTWIKDHDWDQYSNQNVQIYCSNDAVVPAWAYMLLVANLQNAKNIVYGDDKQAKEELFFKALADWDITNLKDKILMVKGCSNIPNPTKAYIVLTQRIVPIAKNLMFGEPCSAVPVYKKKKV